LMKSSFFGESSRNIPSPAPIVFELAEAGKAAEELKAAQELMEKEEAVKEEEEVKKRQLFQDTASSPMDEEVKEETDMVGEKGTLAADTAPDEGPMDGKPKLSGESEVPAIGGLPGEGPGLAEVMEELKAEAFLIEGESPQEEVEEIEASDSGSVEGQEVAVEKPSETPSEVQSAEADLAKLAEEVPAPKETQVAEASPDKTLTEESLLEEKLELLKDEVKERLQSIPEKPKELAYVPPMEARKRSEASPRQGAKASTPTKKRPKVAISFNAKTMAGGEPMPLMEAEDSNAPREGKEAFAVKKDEYAPYYRHIRDRITWYWVLRYGTRQEIKLETENNLPIIVEFKVYPEGVVKEAKIVQEAGNHLLASYVKDTVADTRFKQFPPYVKEEYIDVRFNFYFF
ncbi:MAG: hypothetical protein Q6354_08460, partial [Candidatus Brocadiales bacterium]|nr:hypothetical protein [Candidatus Brocadiales bacterium]